jgi:hypothetical protein
MKWKSHHLLDLGDSFGSDNDIARSSASCSRIFSSAPLRSSMSVTMAYHRITFPVHLKGSQAEQIAAKLPIVPQQSSLKLMGRSLYGPGLPYAKEAS